MPPLNQTKAEFLELAERLLAIATVLQDLSPDNPASASTIDCLRKELGAIAAQLKRNPLS